MWQSQVIQYICLYLNIHVCLHWLKCMLDIVTKLYSNNPILNATLHPLSLEVVMVVIRQY